MEGFCARRTAARGRPARTPARRALPACVWLLLLTAGGGARPARAAEVVLLVADRLARADLWEHPGRNLARLRRESAVALMSSRFLLSSLPESATVALGAGSYVQYEGSVRWRGGGEREDAAAFRVATGRRLPSGALFCREREWLTLYANPGAQIGALGTALHAAGKRTACLGNADLPGRPGRCTLSVLMDGCGMVDGGDVGAATQALDPRAPGGVRVDVAAMTAAFERVAPRADVVAIEFGDTARLAAVAEDLSPAARETARAAALRRLDALVGALRARMDPRRTLFLLVAPAPPVAPSATEQQLTPVFAVGRGFGPGLLLSATTRRPGCIANGDVPATIAALVGASPLPEAAGWPLATAPHPDVGARLRDLDEGARRVSQWRFNVFRAWAVLVAPAVFAWPLLVGWRSFLRRRGRPPAEAARWVAAARRVQLAALALPAAAWLVAGLAPASLGEYLLGLGAAAAGVAAGSRLLERAVARVPAPTWIAALTAGLVLADAAVGSPRLWRMMVSYALTDGARYYGVGNEVMGPVVGLALVGLAALLPAPGRAAAAIAAAAAAAFSPGIGHPAVGANLGGGLTAAVALVALAALLAGMRGWAAIAAPVGAAVALGLALAAADLLRPPEAMSHIGRAVVHARSEGLEWLAAVIERKADLNRVLVQRSRLSRLYFAALPLLLAVGLRPSSGLPIAHPGVRRLLTTGVAGSLAALLLNDSGVIAGGLLLAFTMAGAGYLELGEQARCGFWR
ncbi:MAG: hypothetical protein HY321_11175 [Armatimonadetes bacterium]|nr:hypothetical protein [Armatimonadota bacterium]